MRNSIFADFETCQPINGSVSVYFWCFQPSWNDEIYIGTTIQSFIDKISDICNPREQCVDLFFHNGSGFDNHYLLYGLLKANFKMVFFVDDKVIRYPKRNLFKAKNIKKGWSVGDKEISTLIDDRRRIMNMKFGLSSKKPRNNWKGNNKYINVKDSYLIFPSSLANYGKSIGIEKIDFDGF